MSNETGVAVIGAGYWGRNYVRNFDQMPQTRLLWVCDPEPSARSRAERIAPGVRLAATAEPALLDPAVQAVAIATNLPSHHALALAALRAGKHVLVEKPLAASVEEAEEMVATAALADRILMVGHLMLYHPAVLRLKALIDAGELGRVYYMYALRVNLGRIREDENALWSFAPHDLSMINFLLAARPISVSARGRSYLRPGVEDVVFVNLEYPDATMAQIQLSWLDPHKERRLTVVGSKKMVVFDDTHVSEKLRVYDKGVNQPAEYDSYGAYLSLRNGDIHIPRLSMDEPLKLECNHFLECVAAGAKPHSSGRDGLDVVRILQSAQRSIGENGAPVAIDFSECS